MNVIIGGTFGKIPKSSGIIRQIGEYLTPATVINGGSVLPDTIEGSLVLWMPNVSNEDTKSYPRKPTGTVLICSKLMHEGVSKIDAISRIFKMHGNAVICIFPKEKGYEFELIDALANTWYYGKEIKALCSAILCLRNLTLSSIRIPSYPSQSWIKEDLYLEFGIDKPNMEKLLDINRSLAEKITTQCGNRFFGNVSTRCQSLFPTIRSKTGIYVSPRNSDKKALGYQDMILCSMEDGFVSYHNGDKPSVDTPVQLAIYEKKPEINYMIHGHAFIDLSKTYPFFTGETKNYRLCGDFRETKEVLSMIEGKNTGALVLKNHGFLLFSETLEELEKIANHCQFYIENTEYSARAEVGVTQVPSIKEQDR